MSRFQQGSLLKVKRKSGPDVWVFRWYDETNGTRTYKKRILGKVTDMPLRRDAEKAVADFRANINIEVRVPQTVSELAAHYRKHELTADKKAFATIESTSIYLSNHVVPKWGNASLSDVRTVEVEQWLHSLPYAPATRSKIRNIMSALFNHGIRHEWIHRNPITKVRASAKRLREPDVLSPAELSALIAELPLREKAMVMVAGSTGLRRSELIALTWRDIDPLLIQVNVLRSCVRNHFGDTKTEASRRPVPLHSSVVECLNEWRKESKHNGNDDFLFPSTRKEGKQPITPDMVLKKVIRPALVRAKIIGKVIGWHSFRHSLATNLRAAGADLKTAQELLRHANSRITLDIYTRAISETKRDANNKVMEMILEAGKLKVSAPSPAPSQREPLLLEGSKKGADNFQHPSAPSRAETLIVTVP
ncbi:MAG TPA: site-specific integrase [Acidobacteriaceae bacterium]|jgi:integrase|nr:site-specific integrase [Acidobacteriaceae bacterium]